MSEPEDVVLACVRATPGFRPVAGSQRESCADCETAVWVSAASRSDWQAWASEANARLLILCTACAEVRLLAALREGEQVEWPAMPQTRRAIEAEAARRRWEPPV